MHRLKHKPSGDIAPNVCARTTQGRVRVRDRARANPSIVCGVAGFTSVGKASVDLRHSIHRTVGQIAIAIFAVAVHSFACPLTRP